MTLAGKKAGNEKKNRRMSKIGEWMGNWKGDYILAGYVARRGGKRSLHGSVQTFSVRCVWLYFIRTLFL